MLEGVTASRNQHSIQLRFSAGSWSTFEPRQQSDAPFDLVVTSETIYRSANVPALLSVLRSASTREQQHKGGLFASFSMFGKVPDAQPLILVAAKILYFGVGGSVDEFEGIAKALGASVTTVHETNVGVGRRIMKLRFP
jgi:protein-histidine N-methyltransferase